MLQEMPRPLPLYWKAVTGRKKPKGVPEIPPLEVEMADVGIDANLLSRYREVCGLEDGPSLPITYPQVLAAPLHMHLMSQPQFPLPMIGLVHLRNHVEQSRGLRADERFGVKVRLGEGRQIRQGLEFDLLTEFRAGEETVWSAVTTILYRIPGDKQGKGKAAAPPAPQLSEYRAFDVPEDIGRRYAKVSGDYNPIHLYAPTAKLLGFPRHIAHGMWSLAKVLGLLQAERNNADPKVLDVQFRQPLLLPGKVAVKFQRNGDGIDYALLARGSDKVHLTGRIA